MWLSLVGYFGQAFATWEMKINFLNQHFFDKYLIMWQVTCELAGKLNSLRSNTYKKLKKIIEIVKYKQK
jgi:hypothetical protein